MVNKLSRFVNDERVVHQFVSLCQENARDCSYWMVLKNAIEKNQRCFSVLSYSNLIR
jgi:hypothetical protein